LPVDALNASMTLPTGNITVDEPTIVPALLGSHAPMLKTVGDAKGLEPRSEFQTKLPLSSKHCSTPSVVPVGEATTSKFAPLGFKPKFVPGIASTAVVVGAGRGTDHRRLPEAMSRERSALSEAA